MRRLLTVLLSFITFGASAQTTQLLGGPGIKVLNRGDFQADSIFYLPRTLVTIRAPSQAGALRYQASDSTLYQWTGTAWRKITTDADTLLLSTRAWRQKGDDSLGALIGLRVRFTDTASMLTPYLRKTDTTAMLTPYVRTEGYGLTKGTQTLSVDTGLIATRAWRQKGIDSVANVRVGGSGTTNRVAKFTASGTVGNTAIYENNNLTSIGRNPVFANQPLLVSDSSTGAGQATVFLNSIAGGTDQKNTAIQFGSAISDAFRIRFINDAATDGTNAYTITRSGTQPQIHAWTTATSERMRITAAGELLIGTTTDNGTFTLQNAGGMYAAPNADNVAIQMISGTAVRNAGSQFHDYGTGGSGGMFIRGGSGFTNSLSLLNNGRAVFNGTTDAGYQVDVQGTLRSTGATYLSSTSSTVGIGNTDAATGYLDVGSYSGGSTLRLRSFASNQYWDLQPGTNTFNIKDWEGNTIQSFDGVNNRLGINTTSPSEALHVVGRGRFTTIDSTSSPINLLTSDVNGVIRKTSIAASGGVTGSGTINYIPKFTASTAIGNANIYDSSNTIKIRKSHIGNGASENYAMDMNVDGIGGRGLLISLRDSSTTGPRNAFVIRRSPFSGIAAAPDYGTGFRIELPDGRGTNKFGGNMAAFVTDSSAGDFSTLLAFGVQVKNTTANLMFLRPDSALRLTKLAGSGTRNVAANANGDLVIADVPSSTDSVKMRNGTIVDDGFWTVAEETTNGRTIDQVVKHVDLSGLETVVVNYAAYCLISNFTTSTWTTIGTIPDGFRPTHDLFFPMTAYVEGSAYQTTANTDFTGQVKLGGYYGMRIKSNGNIDVWVGSVDASAQFSGSNNSIIVPVSVSYAILPDLN